MPNFLNLKSQKIQILLIFIILSFRYEGILKENRIQFRQGGGLAAEGAVEGAAAGAGPLKEVHQRTTNAPKAR